MSSCIVRRPRVSGFERLFQDGYTEHLKYLERVMLIGKQVCTAGVDLANGIQAFVGRVHAYRRTDDTYLVVYVYGGETKVIRVQATGVTVV